MAVYRKREGTDDSFDISGRSIKAAAAALHANKPNEQRNNEVRNLKKKCFLRTDRFCLIFERNT